jgi:hypothetical protein
LSASEFITHTFLLDFDTEAEALHFIRGVEYAGRLLKAGLCEANTASAVKTVSQYQRVSVARR